MNKSPQLPIFGSHLKINQFLTIISPPEEIIEYVHALKEDLARQYGDFESRNSIAHITLNSFLIADSRSPFVLSAIMRRLSNFGTFRLEIRDFDFFNDTQKVFLNVNPSVDFDRMVGEYDELNRNFIKTKKFTASKRPHITIGKKLNPHSFDEIRESFSNMTFNYEFPVDRLEVLSYNLIEKRYNPYCEIPLD